MLFIGYFEGIGSQRGIAWRCADSLSLREFLGFSITEATPVHNSMTVIRQRLPESVFREVFLFTLKTLEAGGFLKGKAFGIDATTLEANAAMKSIVRRDNGADWKAYLKQLAQAEGLEDPTDEELQRLDRKRKGKKVSNQEWKSRTDPDSRIAKMKDGRTHLAYKAEHTVQLDSQAIVDAHVTHADRGDTTTGPESLARAQQNLSEAGAQERVEEVVADKGYHSNEVLAQCQECQVRSYIPERRQKGLRRWKDKPEEVQRAYRNNRARLSRAKGKRLSRWRSERVERTFAHVCDTGGSRRSWLRRLINVGKVHQLKCAAYNLGLYLRLAFGMSKPRNWEEGLMLGGSSGLAAVLMTLGWIAHGQHPDWATMWGALWFLATVGLVVLSATRSSRRLQNARS
jgi:transposase